MTFVVVTGFPWEVAKQLTELQELMARDADGHPFWTPPAISESGVVTLFVLVSLV